MMKLLSNRDRMISVILGTISIAAVLWLWEWLSHLRLSSGVELPGPSVVAIRAWQLRSELGWELFLTLKRAFLGLLIATLTMVPLGLAIGRIQGLARVLGPVIEILRPLPTPAIIPFVMLLAGVSDSAKIAIVFYGVMFPILLSSISSVGSIHPTTVNAARSVRLTVPERFLFVYLPAAFPQIAAGIRTSIPVALLVGVTAEMLLSTDGLGVFLRQKQESFQMADGLAGIIVLAVCALLISRINLWSEHKLLFWHYGQTEARDS
jgi:NitT/TauT family transport system permease protein/sulfonate transport system permease protein